MATLKISLTPEQCRAARALLGITQRQLMAASGIGQKTIADFESGARQPFPHTLHELKQSLEKAGVQFIDVEDGVHGAGVVLSWQAELDRRRHGTADNGQDGPQASSNEALAAYWQDRPQRWRRLSAARSVSE